MSAVSFRHLGRKADISGKCRRKKQTGLPSGESAENGWTKAASGSEAGNPFRWDAAIRGRSVRYLVLLRAETDILSGHCFGKRLTDTLSVQVVAEPVMTDSVRQFPQAPVTGKMSGQGTDLLRKGWCRKNRQGVPFRPVRLAQVPVAVL